MALTNFYLDSGGSDNNAGSVINAAASVTSTNGSWDITADTFIATGGTPFSGVNVGDWASIYVDGGTVTTYVAQVVSIFTAGLGVTLSTTAKYGTKPSASATGRSCKIGGSWKTEQVLAAGGFASTTVPQSTKINIKGNLTITATRNISLAGTTTATLWFSGYNTTPGDLDNDTTNSLNKPVWTLNATFTLTQSGNFQLWTSIQFNGNRSGTVVTASGTQYKANRIRVQNTSSNAAALAFTVSSTGALIAYSWFSSTTSASTSGVVSAAAGSVIFVGCAFLNQAVTQLAQVSVLFVNCTSRNSAGSGFSSSTGTFRIINCTVYNATTDGVTISGTPSAPCAVIACIFDTIGGVGINNSSGTNTSLVYRAANDFHSCSGGNEVGFGDLPAFFGQTDGSLIVTSGTDMTPVIGSHAIANGFPGIFENENYISYADIGAVQHLGSGFVPQVME